MSIKINFFDNRKIAAKSHLIIFVPSYNENFTNEDILKFLIIYSSGFDFSFFLLKLIVPIMKVKKKYSRIRSHDYQMVQIYKFY